MKSTAGFVLALIGGILGIIGAIWVFFMSEIVAVPTVSAGAALAGIGAMSATVLVAWGIWMLIMSILAIVAAMWMNKDDNSKVKKGGIMALIVGILGFNLLTLIGGIIGLVQAGK